MKKIFVILIISILILPGCNMWPFGEDEEQVVATQQDETENKVIKEIESKCGDGECDIAEKNDPTLCPKDCEEADEKTKITEQPIEQSKDQEYDAGDAMYFQDTWTTPLDNEEYLSQINTETSSSDWKYKTSFIVGDDPGEMYDVGGFCRVFARKDRNLDITYGGAFQSQDGGYQGIVHKVFTVDGEQIGDADHFKERTTDYAIDTDGEYYYVLGDSVLLRREPNSTGWGLVKYDPNFNYVDETIIQLDEYHSLNDMMLRVWGDKIYAGGLLDYTLSDPGAKVEDMILDEYTHVWMYDTELNYVDDHVIDENHNINGETVVSYDDKYAHVSAISFAEQTLIAMIYDEEWNYIETKEIAENAMWSMGGVVADDTIYIAYEEGGHGRADIVLALYDFDWNLQDKIEVTNVEGFSGSRPWVEITDDYVFASFDLAKLDVHALVPTVVVYERKS